MSGVPLITFSQQLYWPAVNVEYLHYIIVENKLILFDVVTDACYVLSQIGGILLSTSTNVKHDTMNRMWVKSKLGPIMCYKITISKQLVNFQML